MKVYCFKALFLGMLAVHLPAISMQPLHLTSFFKKYFRQSSEVLAYKALRSLDLKKLFRLVQKDTSLLFYCEPLHKNTLLHEAVLKGSLEAVKLLVMLGVPLNVRNAYGQTPLYVAVSIGNEAIVKFLLWHSAHIDAISNTGSTPLHKALSNEQHSVAKRLLEQGASVQTRDDFGVSIGDLVSDVRSPLFSLVNNFALFGASAYEIKAFFYSLMLSIARKGKDRDLAVYFLRALSVKHDTVIRVLRRLSCKSNYASFLPKSFIKTYGPDCKQQGLIVPKKVDSYRDFYNLCLTAALQLGSQQTKLWFYRVPSFCWNDQQHQQLVAINKIRWNSKDVRDRLARYALGKRLYAKTLKKQYLDAFFIFAS